MAENIAFWLYEMCWALATPLLRLNKRLSEGFEQRVFKENLPEPADLWIQSASAGESYLSGMLLKQLKPGRRVNVLMTSATTQGTAILEQTVRDNDHCNEIHAKVACFPFDRPSIMKVAVRKINPKVMVLIETEIWPGLLRALKNNGTHVLIINGRMTEKSLSRYSFMPALWRNLRPERVLAISEDDAERFSALFGKENIDVMPNMKFDRILNAADNANEAENHIRGFLTAETPFVILGSIRREEERDVEKIITELRRMHPEAVIGLFPRHMHRIKKWETELKNLNIPYALRSATDRKIEGGTVVLWDTFGELSIAYKLAKAVFVGGSLAPLGGQNFLEPLTCGVIPVTGPSWENFSWVGSDVAERGLLRIAKNWHEAAVFLSEDLKKNIFRENVIEAVSTYVRERKGGTEIACRVIEEFFQ